VARPSAREVEGDALAPESTGVLGREQYPGAGAVTGWGRSKLPAGSSRRAPVATPAGSRRVSEADEFEGTHELRVVGLRSDSLVPGDEEP
jgi:hypothetical protein